MRTWLEKGIGAGLLTAFVAPAAVPAQVPAISKTEIRRDAQAVTDRRLKELLWEMLRHDDFRRKTPPRSVLEFVPFYTAAVMTEIPLLCRSDTVLLEFAPTTPGSADADTPTRPVGIEVNHLFRYLTLPGPAAREDYVPPHIGGRCGQLDPERDNAFFKAPSARVARDGMIAFLKLLEAVRDKRPIRLTCDSGADEHRSCGELIGAMKPEQIGSVEPCDASGPTRCFTVWIEDREMRVFVAAAGPREGEIESAAVKSYIIIADPRID
jgi:hypothetical protein